MPIPNPVMTYEHMTLCNNIWYNACRSQPHRCICKRCVEL